MQMRSRIVGTGSFAPANVLSNDDMKRFVDTNDEWITTRTGIKNRHIVDPPGSMATSDMALQASLRALEQAGLTANDLDLIIVGTVTPDMRVPSAAIFLQQKLNARRAAAMDVNGACAGSMYALAVADRFLRCGPTKRALVIGAETLSTITNWSDRNTCVLFGDAAGAVIVEAGPGDGPGFLDIDLYSDADQSLIIHVPSGGSKTALTAERLAAQEDKIIMNGREVYKFAVRALVEATETLLARHGMTPKDVTIVCAHQANLRIIESVADRLSVPLERFQLNIAEYGNTSAASCLVTLDEARRGGRVKHGDIVLMMAIGAGMCWSAALYRA
jgi:3-oxoacyl-[acyl-carrier-protein] synthase III